jgi:integrase
MQAAELSVELIEEKSLTYEEVVSFKDNVVWRHLEGISVKAALEEWYKTLTSLTHARYEIAMLSLERHSLLKRDMSLQAFSLLNHNSVIDHIKKDDAPWTECTRQCHAACYISFTKFLNRRFGPVMPVATPCREKAYKTFFKVREKVKTNAISLQLAERFIDYLEAKSKPHALIAKLLLQGAKRITEVLNIKKADINWERGEIAFKQQKTDGKFKETIITFSYGIMQEARTISEANPDSDMLFITKKGYRFDKMDVYHYFLRAGAKCGLPIRMTPHVLRATGITSYRELGCTFDEIMKISGHSTTAAVMAYDKSEVAKNPSKRYNLVS